MGYVRRKKWHLPFEWWKLAFHVHSVVVHNSGRSKDHLWSFLEQNKLFLLIRALWKFVWFIRYAFYQPHVSLAKTPKFSAFFSMKFVMNFFHSRPRTAWHDSAVMCLAMHFLEGLLLRSLGQIWFPRDLVGIMHISKNRKRTKRHNTNYADGPSSARWNIANAAMWLASWEGKIGISCPLSVPQEQMSFGPVNEFFVDQDGLDIDIDFWLLFSVLKAPKKNLANKHPFNSAESASGQDEPNPAFWLATSVGAAIKGLFWPCKTSFIDQARSVKVAVYWPRSFLGSYWLRLLLGQ